MPTARARTARGPGFFAGARLTDQRRARRAWSAINGSPGGPTGSGSFVLFLSGRVPECLAGFAHFLGGEFAGIDEMGDDGQGLAAEQRHQLVDHAVLRGAARDYGLKNVRVADFFGAAHGFFEFEAV